MTDEQAPQPDLATPTADPTTSEATPEKAPTGWRSRRWLAGATLVTVGLAAGGGATYAFTATNSDGPGNGTAVVGHGTPPGGGAGRPTGAPPRAAGGSDGSTTDGQPT